jgi:hypothetical protein
MIVEAAPRVASVARAASCIVGVSFMAGDEVVLLYQRAPRVPAIATAIPAYERRFFFIDYRGT